MHLYIKNMVCTRCKIIVKQVLEKLGIHEYNINLGEVELKDQLTSKQLEEFGKNLTSYGFELLDDVKKQIIEKIKNIVIDQVHYSEEESKYNLSSVLSKELHRDYSYLSNLFSDVEGITIEKYMINQKIEKVKELIIYNELSLSEIAYQMGYSSVAHLSAQFKKTTGLTPSHFRRLKENKRKSLDEV